MIAIIRGEDEPKPVLIAEFSLSDRQAEAILNMRLRSLRKLEKMEIGREREALGKERTELSALIADENLQWRRLKADLKKVRTSSATNGGRSSRKRRSPAKSTGRR